MLVLSVILSQYNFRLLIKFYIMHNYQKFNGTKIKKKLNNNVTKKIEIEVDLFLVINNF